MFVSVVVTPMMVAVDVPVLYLVDKVWPRPGDTVLYGWNDDALAAVQNIIIAYTKCEWYPPILKYTLRTNFVVFIIYHPNRKYLPFHCSRLYFRWNESGHIF
jgi:hypothetical protein